MMLQVLLLLIGINSIANAFYTYQIPTTTTIHCPVSRLYGINEWRDKFSSSNLDSTTSTNHNSTTTLPLLLLPFKPAQIILPGQSTKLQFKQGKYIDIIDEALTSYESVVGLSILDDDGLLPYVVLCEINEESFVMNSVGYRGFSSVKVDVCAVGRAYRVSTTNDLNTEEEEEEEEEKRTFIIRDDTVPGVSKNISFPLDRKQPTKTAQDDIHLGLVHEMYDDVMNDDEFAIANEYLENIHGLLGIPNNNGQQEVQQPLDDRILHQQQLYTDDYTLMLEQQCQSEASLSYTSKEQQLRHLKLVAASWGALAAVTTVRERSQSSAIITKAIETRSVVERLRLGFAMILDSQMPSGREDSSGVIGEQHKENTFQ